MSPATILFVVLLLGALWWLLRQRGRTKQAAARPETRRTTSNTEFHAVSIKVGGHACSAAKAMVGRRFLATAAPKLPLPECDILDCNCRFMHHKDRRSSRDRRSPFAPSGMGGGTGAFDTEQRDGKDRRKNDQ